MCSPRVTTSPMWSLPGGRAALAVPDLRLRAPDGLADAVDAALGLADVERRGGRGLGHAVALEDRHHDGTRLEDPEVGDQELGDVGQLQAHEVTGANPGRLQPGGQPGRQRVQFRVAELAARVHHGGPVRGGGGCLLENHREVEVHDPAPPRRASVAWTYVPGRPGTRPGGRACRGPRLRQGADTRPGPAVVFRTWLPAGTKSLPGEPGPLIPACGSLDALDMGVFPELPGL